MASAVDDGFVVSDASPLDSAYRAMVELFTAGGLIEADKQTPAFAWYTNYGRAFVPSAFNDVDAWIGRATLGELAEQAMRRALETGELVVWTADATGERSRDGRVLFGPDVCKWRPTLHSGTFIPLQGQPDMPPSYVRARLWLKNADWACFHLSTMRSRYGVNALPTDQGGTVSTAAAERECDEWLAAAFAADADNRRAKNSFQTEALSRFTGRLSVRGFKRSWERVAPSHGRTRPGRRNRTAVSIR